MPSGSPAAKPHTYAFLAQLVERQTVSRYIQLEEGPTVVGGGREFKSHSRVHNLWVEGSSPSERAIPIWETSDTQVVSPGESSRVSPIQWFYIISHHINSFYRVSNHLVSSVSMALRGMALKDDEHKIIFNKATSNEVRMAGPLRRLVWLCRPTYQVSKQRVVKHQIVGYYIIKNLIFSKNYCIIYIQS